MCIRDRTTTARLITPGLDDTRAAYESIRALGVDPHTAADWLRDHVRTVTRDDLATQLDRNHGRANTTATVTDPHALAMVRALRTAVKVYNRSRPRLTVVDQIATESGAAAVNRAAVLRQVRTPSEGPAFLGRYNIQRNGTAATLHGYEIAGRLHISGGAVRAFIATFTTGDKPRGMLRLADFRVILPGKITH